MLYAAGRVSGSVYTGRGQEGVGAAAGYALGPDDVCAPLNRELACHLARGVTAARRSATSSARATPPRAAATATCTSARRERGVFPLVSMLGDLCPVASAPPSPSSGAASRASR